MNNMMHAYLQTEGVVDYRDCQISYYTFSMFETPKVYRVNVNVYIHSDKTDIKKSLNLNDSFNDETEAINYGIEQGKQFIDQIYAKGKIIVLKTDNKNVKSDVKDTTSSAKEENKKKEQR